MTVWEYKVIQGAEIGGRINTVNLQATLDRLGRDGWELACAIPAPANEEPFIIFKRPLD